jgi:hypothetical protein
VRRRLLFSSLAVAAAVLGTATAASSAPSTAHSQPKNVCASKPSKWQREQCEGFIHSAPGDQYFGRMKLSYLGINNTFHDDAIRAGDYTTNSGIISQVGFADEALEQWAKQYPDDPQLARSYFLAIQVYQKIYTRPAQQKAWKYMHVLVNRFGSTYFGKVMKADLARGFTEHWFANATTCPTPLPSGAPRPQRTPNTTATPQPRPGKLLVDVITPPCVKSSPLP